jgi:LmbE family N-acetylglucosaminyl deacetylase
MNDLIYGIRRLRTWGCVLHVGAHPDDEEIGLIAYLTHKLGIRTVYWSATRGEGGQDASGRYDGEALGIYRTWESLAAREVDGGESLFGPFYDYDYAKTSGEVFRKWRREDLVREIVRAIRSVQPQVIVARWTGGESDQHGHHKAVGEATIEAFRRAGDAESFPELVDEGLHPWTAAKLYQSVAPDWTPGERHVRHGERRPDLEVPGIVAIDTGEFDPIARETYQERAWRAFNSHRTQSIGFAPSPGEFWYYYRLVATRVASPEREATLFDGLDLSLPGMVEHYRRGAGRFGPLLRAATAAAERALADFHPYAPADVAPALLEGLAHLRAARAALPDERCSESAARILDRKIQEFERTIAHSLGLRLEAVADRPRVTPGERVAVQARLWSKEQAVADPDIVLHAPAGWLVEQTAAGTFGVTVPADAEPTRPYWLRVARDDYRYTWPTDAARGAPFDAPVLEAGCVVDVAGSAVTLRAPVVHRAAFTGGFRTLPVSVVPPVSLEVQPGVLLVPAGTGTRTWRVDVTVRANTARPIEARLRMDAPAGWRVTPESADIAFDGVGQAHTRRFELRLPARVRPGRYTLRLHAHCDGREHASVMRAVRAASSAQVGEAGADTCTHEAFVIAPAELAVHVLDVRLPERLRVGYIVGSPERLPAALESLAIETRVLADADVAWGALEDHDAIVVGPNAYVLRETLRAHARRLLDYVADGGTLIVQHQGYGYAGSGLAPFPLEYREPHDRVTDEHASVALLEPAHPALSSPNAIGARDFDGWVRDRGLYFLGPRADEYAPLLACADPGEEPKDGGLVVARHGQGLYVYCAYSLFRQVPAGVPGGVRLLANLLALPLTMRGTRTLERRREERRASVL